VTMADFGRVVVRADLGEGRRVCLEGRKEGGSLLAGGYAGGVKGEKATGIAAADDRRGGRAALLRGMRRRS
jgi:hypothetical protein